MSLTYKQPKDNMRASLNTSKSTIKNNLAADILDYRFDGMAGSYLEVCFSVPFCEAATPKNVTGIHLVTKGNVILDSITHLSGESAKSLADKAMSLIEAQSIKTYLINVASCYVDSDAVQVKEVIQRATHPIHAVGAALSHGFNLSYDTIKTHITDSATRGEELIVASLSGNIHFIQSVVELKEAADVAGGYSDITQIIEASIADSINNETRELLRANELVLTFKLFKENYGCGIEYGVGDVHLSTSNNVLLASLPVNTTNVSKILTQTSAASSYQQEITDGIEKLAAKALKENPSLTGAAPITSEVKPPLFALMSE